MKDLKDMDLWDQPDEGDPLVWLREYRDKWPRNIRHFVNTGNT